MSGTKRSLIAKEVASLREIASFHDPKPAKGSMYRLREDKPAKSSRPKTILCICGKMITATVRGPTKLVPHGHFGPGNSGACIQSDMPINVTKCGCSVCGKSVYLTAGAGGKVIERHSSPRGNGRWCPGVGLPCSCETRR